MPSLILTHSALSLILSICVGTKVPAWHKVFYFYSVTQALSHVGIPATPLSVFLLILKTSMGKLKAKRGANS